LKLRMMELVVTTGAIRRAKLQSNHHHQQTNTQLFTGLVTFPSPNQQCRSTEGKDCIHKLTSQFKLHVYHVHSALSACVNALISFHSRLKTYLFQKYFTQALLVIIRLAWTDSMPLRAKCQLKTFQQCCNVTTC